MATHRETRAIARSPEYLFDIVADVEGYPEFLPLVSSARIINRREGAYETEQSLALGLLTHRFKTLTKLDRPRTITVISEDRSFSRFHIRWNFSALDGGQCQVDFELDCETRLLLLKPVMKVLIMPMATSMVSAFEARAHALAKKAGLSDARR